MGGEAARGTAHDEAPKARQGVQGLGRDGLLGQALARGNLVRAWKRVRANRGSAGVDGRTIDQTAQYLKTEWPRIREALLDGSYRPMPVRRVEIAKPDGGTRQLGIPTVVDRLIQQALLQVLQPGIDATFSDHSYGFRPGRSGHDAVLAAQRHVQAGFRVVVDVDLEKFFDRVNHDILMHRLARRIDDKSVLRLIRRYLAAGAMDRGVVIERHEGTPQGGPLSPLLANVLAFLVAFCVSYSGHALLTFARHRTPHLQAIPRFFAVSCASFAVNELLYIVALRVLHLHYFWSLVAVLLIVSVLTFVAAKFWAFARVQA